MGHRINERNIGNYTLDGELKKRSKAPKKTTRSFADGEMEMAIYVLSQVVNNIELDATDPDNQVFRDNGNILIQFDRERIEDLRSLIDKFTK